MCCLKYEHPFYTEFASRAPAVAEWSLWRMATACLWATRRQPTPWLFACMRTVRRGAVPFAGRLWCSPAVCLSLHCGAGAAAAMQGPDSAAPV